MPKRFFEDVVTPGDGKFQFLKASFEHPDFAYIGSSINPYNDLWLFNKTYKLGGAVSSSVIGCQSLLYKLNVLQSDGKNTPQAIAAGQFWSYLHAIEMHG